MWVKSEYAGEVAVLSTWLCALLPWSVSLLTIKGATAVWIRFLPGRFLYVFGVPTNRPFRWVWEIPGFVSTRGEVLSAYVWLAGAVVFLLPLGLSVLYYVREDYVDSWDYDPVRLMGGLLVTSGGLLFVASAMLWWFTTTTLPIGSLIQMGLGVVLLRAERT